MPQEVELKGDGRALIVRNWHVIVLLAVQLLALAVAYGRITEQLDDTVKQLEKIEARPVVTQNEWDSWRNELISRMDRLEIKIDSAVK